MSRKHVLVIVFPGFGHYIPGLELCKKLAPYHDVTLCISGSKIPEIHQRGILPPENIKLFGIDDQLSFQLDERFDELKEYYMAMHNMKPYYETFINSLPTPDKPASNEIGIPTVHAIFVDLGFATPLKYVHARGIPGYAFCPCSSTFLASYVSIDENTPTTTSEEAFLSGSQTDSMSLALPVFVKEQAVEDGRTLELATEIVFNSFEELEPKALELFNNMSRFAHIPKKFIGPLLPTDEHLDQKNSQREHHILSWLNAQNPKSVVYFSFGTMALPKPEQIVEVAAALTSLKRPFIWALRPFLQKHLPEEYKVCMTDDCTTDAPYLIVPWAPQKRILAHKSTGVFVSHCGWNSTLEGVAYGVPILAWPMCGDQPISAKVLEEMGVGITLKDTGIVGRIIPREEIIEAVLTVAGWKEGMNAGKYRRAMEELGEKAREAIEPDGKSTRNLLSVISQI